MSEERFSPAPWFADWKNNPTFFPFVWRENGYAVAKMCGRPNERIAGTTIPVACLSDFADPEKVLANAALIAAAPEMYAELERHCALCMLQHPECEKCKLCETRKVLKKARGEE